MFFQKSTDICISWGQSIEHVKNILTSLKAAALKFSTEQRSWEKVYFIWEFIHSHSSIGFNTTPPPKGIHHKIPQSWYNTILKRHCVCGLKKTRPDDSPSSGEWPVDSPIHACQCMKRGCYEPPSSIFFMFLKITSHRGFAETVTQSRIRIQERPSALGLAVPP